jgi:hypothetical protein
MELTKEYFDQQLSKLATKENLSQLATSAELTALDTKVDELKKTVDGHTTSLAYLVGKKKTKIDETTIAAARVDRLEKWAAQVATKLGIKLEL